MLSPCRVAAAKAANTKSECVVRQEHKPSSMLSPCKRAKHSACKAGRKPGCTEECEPTAAWSSLVSAACRARHRQCQHTSQRPPAPTRAACAHPRDVHPHCLVAAGGAQPLAVLHQTGDDLQGRGQGRAGQVERCMVHGAGVLWTAARVAAQARAFAVMHVRLREEAQRASQTAPPRHPPTSPSGLSLQKRSTSSWHASASSKSLLYQ